MVQGHFRTYSYPEEEFFGIGPNSQRANQVAYDLDGTTVGGQLDVRPFKPFSFGGGYEHLQATVSPADSDRLPPIDVTFPPGTIPPLREHEYSRTFGYVSFDYRQPLNARRGGWYQFEVSQYTDLRDQDETFTRMDVDLRQFVSFFAERRVIAARVRVSTTETDHPDLIPIFLLPSLGGNDTLRGFRANRFRGRHSMLMQAEYRWEIWSGLEAALFYDTGKVVQQRSNLDFNGLESDYGFGFRLNTDNGIIARVDAAFGSRDGKHLHIVFGGIF
jgi:outer membrane protein assembly factor BamA